MSKTYLHLKWRTQKILSLTALRTKQWLVEDVNANIFAHASSGSSMRMATQRMSVSSTERWSTATPSSRWWPSSKPWPASRSTTAALWEWWDVHTATSPGPQTCRDQSPDAGGPMPHTVLILQQTDGAAKAAATVCCRSSKHISATTPPNHPPQSLFPC